MHSPPLLYSIGDCIMVTKLAIQSHVFSDNDVNTTGFLCNFLGILLCNLKQYDYVTFQYCMSKVSKIS